MEVELGRADTGFFIEFVGEDLVEKLGLELLVFVCVPDEHLGVHTLHVLLFVSLLLICLLKLFRRLAPLGLENVMTHLAKALQTNLLYKFKSLPACYQQSTLCILIC